MWKPWDSRQQPRVAQLARWGPIPLAVVVRSLQAALKRDGQAPRSYVIVATDAGDEAIGRLRVVSLKDGGKGEHS